MMARRIRLPWFALALAAYGVVPPVAHAQPVDFAKEIRPILAAHCYECHGAKRQESNYRLDVRDVALAAADFGSPPIVPGDADGSPLVQYVLGTSDLGVIMPPEDKPRLPDEAIGRLRRWIDQGAVWPDALAGTASATPTTDHWSFQPLSDTAPPSVASDWVRNGVDAFIYAALDRNGLAPSPPADRRTLIRRVYLDMLGLPPTPRDVQQFMDDKSPDAYDRLVERVLNSPHYGERWARHWLDVVRFGDSHGFETNPERPRAYHYRDYVINALNEDMPYDQFVMEQIAGDALGADAATGFLVAGPHDLVKSPDINLTLMQRQDELADMVNTTGTAFLGLTVGCARCHNHKFDPILQKDYYALQAVFAGVQHGERPLQTAVPPALLSRIASLREQLETAELQLNAWRERAEQHAATEGRPRPPVDVQQNVEQFPPIAARWVRFSVEATNSGGEPCLDELEIFASVDNSGSEAPNVALASSGAKASASGTLDGFSIHQLAHIHDGRYGNEYSWISDTAGTGWVQIELAQVTEIHKIVWGRDRNAGYRDRLPTTYRIEVAVEPGEWIEVASSADRRPLPADAMRPDRFIEYLPLADAETARQLYAATLRMRDEVTRLQESIPVAYVGQFTEPPTIHRLYRGDPMAPREEVLPDTFSVAGSLSLTSSTPEQQRRLALARWIASKDNPLTARVIVNRLWHYHFGTGLVSTPSDFGANGASPTHPELLDWLARQLHQYNGSLKQLHRLILLSSTYRQSSTPHAEGLDKDAGTRLLWRFPPRRLEAEIIRDCILSVAGTLNLEAGGPGFNVFDVKKETVHHYFPKTDFGPTEWRRMVYMTKIRQEQDAVFGAFDCPDAGQVTPDRTQSTTPLQALNLLNSPFMLEQADWLARRLIVEAGDDTQSQVRRAFQFLFSRDPDEAEMQKSLELVRRFGLPALCRALLNANEFLFLS